MNGLIEGIHFYYNKEGLFVFTEQYHLEKGDCCGNGCLHCPYSFKDVKEDRINGNADDADTTDITDLISK